MSKFKIGILALAMVAGAAGAATQGTLGPTSTGSFTNTFNGNARQIQILNRVDLQMSPNSPNINWLNSNVIPGAQGSYCVVDTGGGAVHLTFTSSVPPVDVQTRNAVDAAGVNFPYTLGVANSVVWTIRDLATTGITVPSNMTVTAAGGCAANANFLLTQIVTTTGAPMPASTNVFVDTITVVATPI